LSFKEKREFEQLEKEIAELEDIKNEIELVLHSGELNHDELYQKSEELVRIKTSLDEKEFRWLELSELS
jgi:ATP-binding cassette subfamily F protein uup